MDSNVVYDASFDAQMEQRNEVEHIRDDSQSVKVGNSLVGKIKEYRFRILVRDKEDLVGSLSREDMEKIHRLYCTQGSGLTQRGVSREFSQFTFEEFKKILRAFNITKASSPLAPHIIEERSLEDQVKLTFQHKENDYLKKLEQERATYNENRLKEVNKENLALKNQILNFKEFVKTLEFKIKPLKVNKPNLKTDSTIVVYISDMHIGAEVSEYSIYSNTFNYKVAEERLTELTRKILETCYQMKINNIVVCNIGDSLDGYNAETTRGGHKLPQNMNNKDQYKNFLDLMIGFFADLSSSEMFDTIRYFCVDGGNHK